MWIVAAAVVGGAAALGSAYLASEASESAAETQAQATESAVDVEWEMFQQSRADQAPWREAGESALASLVGTPETEVTDPETGEVTTVPGTPGLLSDIPDFERPDSGPAPIRPEVKDFVYEESPGYQFLKERGEEAITSALSARGLTDSGGELKELTKFAIGTAAQDFENSYRRWSDTQTLADARYSTDFTNWLNQSTLGMNQQSSDVNTWLNTQINPAMSLAGAGQVSATNIGQQGMTAASNVGDLYMAGANATAQGQINSANAWSSGLQGVGNTAMWAAGQYNS